MAHSIGPPEESSPLDSRPIDRSVVGDSGYAQEKRASRIAAARAAVERARELRRDLRRVRNELPHPTRRLSGCTDTTRSPGPDHAPTDDHTATTNPGEAGHARDGRIVDAPGGVGS